MDGHAHEDESAGRLTTPCLFLQMCVSRRKVAHSGWRLLWLQGATGSPEQSASSATWLIRVPNEQPFSCGGPDPQAQSTEILRICTVLHLF